MAQVIIYEGQDGKVHICVPTPEFLENNTIEDVLAKDCPDHAIIVDESELPEERDYTDAWELVDGKVVVNETKKQAIIDAQQTEANKKQAAEAKLAKLGLTTEDLKMLLG